MGDFGADVGVGLNLNPAIWEAIAAATGWSLFWCGRGLSLNPHPLTAEVAAPKCLGRLATDWRGMESDGVSGLIRPKHGMIREFDSPNGAGPVAHLGLISGMVRTGCVVVCLAVLNGGVTGAQQANGQAGGTWTGTPSGTGNGTSSEKTVLRGTVVNAVTHQPIGRALVKSQDGRYATMTNERGRFEMVFKEKKNVPPEGTAAGSTGEANAQGNSGPAMYLFPRPGVLTQAQSTQAQPQQTTVDRPDSVIASRPGFLEDNTGGTAVARDQEEITISMMPEARVVGHVLLADGEGALGMQVLLYSRAVQGGRTRWIQADSTQTRSDGEFRFAGLVAGTYRLFSAELNDRDPVTSSPRGPQFGYPPDYYPSATDFEGAALIHIAAGEVFQATLNPERKRYYPVKIGVANRAGNLSPQIDVWRDGHPGPGFALGYDDREGAVVGTLPDGNYVVKILGTSGNTLVSGVTNLSVNGGPATGMVSVASGSIIDVRLTEEFGNSETTQQLRQAIALPPPQVEGQPAVRRKPRLGGYVQLMLMSSEEFDFQRQYNAQSPSDPDAEGMVFENVPPGEYRVIVNTPFGYVASIRCGDKDLLTSSLVIGGGGALPPIEVTLRDDGAQLNGSVVEVANRNHSGNFALGSVAGFVYLAPVRENAQLKMTIVQADGSFELTQLPPGTYRVVAFEKQNAGLEFWNEEEMRKYDTQLITVLPGQKEKIQVSFVRE
jgi:hypothetical protein